MNHSQNDLDELWSIVKESEFKNPGIEGLLGVDFTLPLVEFTQKHQSLVTSGYSSIITTRVSEAVNTLAHADVIETYHLSHAAPNAHPGEDNTALCIHYSASEMLFALAIPGINYKLKQE